MYSRLLRYDTPYAEGLWIEINDQANLNKCNKYNAFYAGGMGVSLSFSV